MNILASYRYQLADHKKSILVFYLVEILVVCAAILFKLMASQEIAPGVQISVSGCETATFIFLFVVGVCSFREPFLFSVQNGISRKTLFTAKLLTMVSVAAIMSAVDTVLFLIQKGVQAAIHSNVQVDRVYALYFGTQGDGTAMLLVKSFVLEFLMALAIMAIGYFIAVLFYRLGKGGRIAVVVGFLAFSLFGLPFLNSITHGVAAEFGALLSHAAFGTPLRMCLAYLFLFAAASGLAFLLMRRAVVRTR